MASCGCQNLAAARCYMSNFGNPSVNRRTSTNLGRSYRYFRSYFSIYICCTYTYILHTAHSLQQKGTRKRTRKSDENEVHFPRRPLRYGLQGASLFGKISALTSRFYDFWKSMSSYHISSFLFLRWLRRDVAIPLEPETWAERESMQAKTGATHLR